MRYEIYIKNEHFYKILLRSDSTVHKPINNQIQEKAEQNGWKLQAVGLDYNDLKKYFYIRGHKKLISFLIFTSKNDYLSARAEMVREFIYHVESSIPNKLKEKDKYPLIADSVCFCQYDNSTKSVLIFPDAEDRDFVVPVTNHILNAINKNEDYRKNNIIFSDNLNEWFASTNNFFTISNIITIDDFLKDAQKDPNFNAFISDVSQDNLLQLSTKLQKSYGVLIYSKHGVYLEWKELTSFEIVANMGLKLQAEVLLINVYAKIDALNNKGKILINTGFNKKGEIAKQLAQQIKEQIDNLKNSIINDQRDVLDKFEYSCGYKEEACKNIRKLIIDGYKLMGDERNCRDIIGHICLALTGIGLLFILANKLYSGQFFFNNTERQCRLKDVNHEIDIILKMKSI